MTIVYVYNSLALWGGVERIFADKMSYLADRYGYEIYMLTYNQGQHPVPFALSQRVHLEDLGVDTHHQYRYHGPRRYWERIVRQLRLRRKMKARLDAIRPDIIVTTTAGPLSLLLQVKGQAALVVESHSDFLHVVEADQMTWRHRIEQRRRYQLLRKADTLVALTEADAVHWRQLTPRVAVIPNIVHPHSAGHQSTLEQQRAIFVGRFARQKALPDLLATWQLVNKRHPEWRLDIYGEGENRQQVAADVARMEAHIHVHEPTHDIIERYCESSLLLLTSRYEPFGLVITEAMGCGLPVVSFEGDGPCSIICDGKDGFLVANGDIQQLANRICQLIEDPTLRHRMGREALLTAQRYTAENIMPQWKTLFEALVADRSGRSDQ